MLAVVRARVALYYDRIVPYNNSLDIVVHNHAPGIVLEQIILDECIPHFRATIFAVELNPSSWVVVYDIPLYRNVGRPVTEIIAYIHAVAVLSARAGIRIDAVLLDHISAYEDVARGHYEYTLILIVVNPVILDRVMAFVELYALPAVPDFEPFKDYPLSVELDPRCTGVRAAVGRILAVTRIDYRCVTGVVDECYRLVGVPLFTKLTLST